MKNDNRLEDVTVIEDDVSKYVLDAMLLDACVPFILRRRYHTWTIVRVLLFAITD